LTESICTKVAKLDFLLDFTNLTNRKLFTQSTRPLQEALDAAVRIHYRSVRSCLYVHVFDFEDLRHKLVMDRYVDYDNVNV